MRITEEHRDIRGHRELGMTSHFHTLIPGQRSPQLVGQLADTLGQDYRDPVGTSIIRDPREHHESAVPLDQGRDLRFPAFSDD
jgi:hypothetical protein